MKTDCAALRQSKTNPATAGSTTNTLQVMMMRIMSMTMVIVLSGPVAGYDLDIVPRPESTELRKLAPGHALHLVYIIIIIQPYHSGVYNYNYTIIYTCVYNYNYKDT